MDRGSSGLKLTAPKYPFVCFNCYVTEQSDRAEGVRQ